MIRIKGLSKRYKDVQAVENLDMHVKEGDIYGLLGPNGSGKSTTIRMMLSLVYPDRGNINIFGMPLSTNRVQILKRIGALVEKPDFYEHLSAVKNLEILSKYSGYPVQIKRIQEILELVGISERGKSKVKTFSKGMKQRLGIAQALIHDPELLVLDEPASGLDPSGIRDIRKILLYLNKDLKKTIILSSHLLNEIELIANRMIIINKGKKLVEGEVKNLLIDHSYFSRFIVNDIPKSLKILESKKIDIEKIEHDEIGIRVYCRRDRIPEINSLLVKEKIEVYAIELEQSLEDYFLTLT
jgi:ABC-type multidrug transport system ATPase subunit